MSSTIPLGIMKTGAALESVEARYGDYDRLFVEAIWGQGEASAAVQPHVFKVGEGLSNYPSPRGLAGVIVTGSSASVTAQEAWMGEAGGWLLGAASLGLPILGVCFGHQLLADAYGGAVQSSERGREAGTATVTLSPAGRNDPLFEGLPEALLVQEAHSDTVTSLPEGALLLASNQHSQVQAARFAEGVYGVQFHPEFSREISLAYLEGRVELIREAAVRLGEEPDAYLERLRAELSESPHGTQLLRNWARILK